jgi:hypothetical protein
LAQITENWPKSTKIGQKSPKIGQNRRKLAKMAENWPKSPKTGIIPLKPETEVSRNLTNGNTARHDNGCKKKFFGNQSVNGFL